MDSTIPKHFQMSKQSIKISDIIHDTSIGIDEKENLNLYQAVRELVIFTLNKHKWNKEHSAKDLKISVRSVYHYIETNFIVYDTKEKVFVSLLSFLGSDENSNRFVPASLNKLHHLKKIPNRGSCFKYK